MAGKIEWQFKYRDEGHVNARTGQAGRTRKKSAIGRRFCNSSETVYHRGVRKLVTTARCEREARAACLTAIIREDGTFAGCDVGEKMIFSFKRASAAPRQRWHDPNQIEIQEIITPARTPAPGTRASANTSGPDSTLAERLLARRLLGKLRQPSIRRTAPNEENWFPLPDRTS